MYIDGLYAAPAMVACFPPTTRHCSYAMSRSKTIPTGEVEKLIAQGRPVVVHEGYALDLGEWIDKHPGGRLAILHMVGRDATDEINM